MKRIILFIVLLCVFFLTYEIKPSEAKVVELNSQVVPVYTAKSLAEAARNGSMFFFQSSGKESTVIALEPAESSVLTKKYCSLTLNFRAASPITVFALYVFHRTAAKITYAPVIGTPVISLIKDQPPAAQLVASELGKNQFKKLNMAFMIGAAFQIKSRDIGNLVIESTAKDSFKFVIYVTK